MLWVAKKIHISLGVEMFQYKLAIEKICSHFMELCSPLVPLLIAGHELSAEFSRPQN